MGASSRQEKGAFLSDTSRGDREVESRPLTPGASVLGAGPGQEGRGGSRLTQRESPRKSIQHGLLNRGVLLFSLLKTLKPFPPNWG